MSKVNKNRKFIEKYELKNDGSLGDRFMAGCKRAIAEEAATSPEERRKQRAHYRKKMAEIVTTAKNYPGYDAIFPNPSNNTEDGK